MIKFSALDDCTPEAWKAAALPLSYTRILSTWAKFAIKINSIKSALLGDARDVYTAIREKSRTFPGIGGRKSRPNPDRCS